MDFPALWQQKCVNKWGQLGCSFPLVSFHLNNFPSRSWGLCLPFIPSNWILAAACQEQGRGAVCLCQLHWLSPEATRENVQPQRTETRKFGLSCWACMWEAASWLWADLPSAPPAQGAEQRLAGGLAHFPCSRGLCGLLDNRTWRPLGHRADSSGAPAAKVTQAWRFLSRALCWVISFSHVNTVHSGNENTLQSWLLSPNSVHGCSFQKWMNLNGTRCNKRPRSTRFLVPCSLLLFAFR